MFINTSWDRRLRSFKHDVSFSEQLGGCSADLTQADSDKDGATVVGLPIRFLFYLGSVMF